MTKKDKISFEIVDQEWASSLQHDLDNYMFELYDQIDSDEDDQDSEFETESGIPFCGCNVCEGREILSFVTPRIIKGFLDQKVNIITI